jgi:antitoxin CcdA
MSNTIRNLDNGTTHRVKMRAARLERLIGEKARDTIFQSSRKECAHTFEEATLEARKWREEHVGFIAAYNATLEAEGLPLNEWRSF